MQITRKLNNSFMYFLLEQFGIEVKKRTLPPDGTRKIYKIPHPNIVFTKPIEIYIDDELADKNSYKIFPLLGDVIFENPVTGTVTASYYYSPISIVGHTGGEIIHPPLVAIENSGDNEYALELGSSRADVDAFFRIHLYATNQAQRDDLCDMIKAFARKTLVIYDYSKGFPLASDGSLHEVEIPVERYALLERVSVLKNPLESTDEIEVGRALITVVCNYVN
jgi:hypothetical protein